MKAALATYKDIFEGHLKEMLEEYKQDIQPIFDALCYGVIDGGKRIRPILCYLAAEFCGKTAEDVKNFAVGVEMIHSYSLVHDDLPCMDDDELRRGKPAVHVVFGEGMAVLAGDALLNMAFEVMLGEENFDKNSLNAVRYAAKNSGIFGMIGGQCLDLSNKGEISGYSVENLRLLNKLKTSCLLKSALVGSAIKCGADAKEVGDLEAYADSLGEIFQIVDDILDRTSSEAVLGKQVNQDRSNGKLSVVDVIGMENAERQIEQLESAAVSKLISYGERGKKLIDLCKFLSRRTK